MSDNFENENEFNEDSKQSSGNDFEVNSTDFVFPSSATDEEYRVNNDSAEERKPEPDYNVPVGGETYNYQQSPYQNNSYNNRNSYGAPNQQFTPYGYNQPPMKPKKSGKGRVAAVVIILAIVVVALASIIGSTAWRSITRNDGMTTPTENNISGASQTNEATIDYATTAATSSLSAVQIAEKVRPSVVGVMTYKNGQLSGEGTGVVMGLDSTGKYTYIITCAHVISENGVSFSILTLEGKRYEASMVAYDTRTDIGVLKVETTDLVACEFGDSTTLKVGETVYAIGNPGGSEYFGSITDGIISAIDRSISSTYTMTCIQHNAAINPGNSGGALVNSAGQVIGINSSKIAATDFEGMGFAIPMSTVKPIVESLIKYNYVPNRPKLGIQYSSVDSYQLYSMVVAIKGLPKGSLIIAAISDDSSLAKTKAQVGDLIIAVNGKDMDDSSVLLDLIDKGAVGDSLTLTLCRVENRTYKTSIFDVTITLVEDRGETTSETTSSVGGYNYGGASNFEDFFKEYFGFDW